MANEPIFNVASFDCKAKLCSAQTVVETRLLPMGGVSISKVLSYSAGGYAAATDVFTGEARVAGRVNFRVLFLDGEGNPRNIETAVDFTDKIIGDAITGGKPEIISRILDTDIISVAQDEIKLAAIVEMELFDNQSERIKYLQFAGDDVYAHEERAEYQRLAAKVTDTLSLSDEVKAEGERILLAESGVVVLKRMAGADNILIEGEIITNIITEKEGSLFSLRTVTPFSNECAAEGVKSGFFVDASAKLVKSSATMMLDEASAAVNLEFEIEITAYAYVDEEIMPIADAFSVISELSMTSAELTLTKNRVATTVFERVEGSVTLGNDMPIADKILASAAARLNVANAYASDEKLILEGTVTASIIYFSAETGAKNSVDVELPFSITTMESVNGKVMSAYGEVTQLTAKIRRGNEIDIKTEIAVSVSAAEAETLRVITELAVGDPVEIPAAAVSLHIARPKETLWEVAKALKTTPELLLLQNPGINLPLAGGERVIVYRHLKK